MMSSAGAVAGPPATQGRIPGAGPPGHPGSQLEWHAAGYEQAMQSMIDLALALAERPDITAHDILCGVIELALGVVELGQGW